MLRLFGPGCETLPIDADKVDTLPESVVWVDLVAPTRQEEKLAERLIGLNIPTRTEMLEIEPSSRLYERGGVTVMTMTALYWINKDCPGVDPVSFILTDKHLVTVRYVEPTSFEAFADHAYADPSIVQDPLETLVGLFDAIVDRLADRIEEVSDELDRISQQIFVEAPRETRRSPELRYEVLMLRIGAVQRVLAKVREASVSAARVIGYLQASDRIESQSARGRHLKSLLGDVGALNDHSNFVGENLNFLLDASLGMISLQQNLVMKIFSVVAVVLMPPTLIAGIYGMNFDFMPELNWPLGYPFSIVVMLLSAVLPYLYARRKGWL
jgi:magnesium transporter